MLVRHDSFHVLDHDDSVVHHDSYRKYHCEQGERVDRESEELQAEERADDAHRHREYWNESRAPALQEGEYDQRDEKHRLEQCLHDFGNGFRDERRRVEGDPGFDAWWQRLGQLLEPRCDPVLHVEVIGTGTCVHHYQRRRRTIHSASRIVALRAEVHVRDVA